MSQSSGTTRTRKKAGATKVILSATARNVFLPRVNYVTQKSSRNMICNVLLVRTEQSVNSLHTQKWNACTKRRSAYERFSSTGYSDTVRPAYVESAPSQLPEDSNIEKTLLFIASAHVLELQLSEMVW